MKRSDGLAELERSFVWRGVVTAAGSQGWRSGAQGSRREEDISVKAVDVADVSEASTCVVAGCGIGAFRRRSRGERYRRWVVAGIVGTKEA